MASSSSSQSQDQADRRSKGFRKLRITMPDHVANHVDVEKPQNAPNRRSPSKFRWWLWILVATVLAVGAYIFFRSQTKARAAKSQQQTSSNTTVPISTVTARRGDIGVYVNALGTVTPIRTVSVTSRVVGAIESVNYKEGQVLHEGDALLEIDPRPYQAQLTQFEGQLARDQALLNEARINHDRYQQAFARNAIPKQQLDDQAQLVAQNEGTVKSDQGLVDNARLNVAYCHITSPID